MTKTKKRTFLLKVRRWLIWLLVVWFSTTLTLVLVMRWFDPPNTAFMLQRLYSDEHVPIELKYEWRELTRISP